MRNGYGVKCSFPVTTNSSNGTLGKARFHTDTTENFIYETTSI